jgi:hypothetical protein
MLKLIQLHLTSGWPDLLYAFLIAKTNASPYLYYTGPKIELKLLTKCLRLTLRALGFKENHDFSLAPLDANELQLAITTAMARRPSSDEEEHGDEDEDEDSEDDEQASLPLSNATPSDSSMRPPPGPSTPPPRKRGHPSPASTPSKTPSSSRPHKRAK